MSISLVKTNKEASCQNFSFSNSANQRNINGLIYCLFLKGVTSVKLIDEISYRVCYV